MGVGSLFPRVFQPLRTPIYSISPRLEDQSPILTWQCCQATGFRPGSFPGEEAGVRPGAWVVGARLGDSGEKPIWGSMRAKYFFLGFLMFFEKNSQLSPGKKEISLFKTAFFLFFVFLFFCETTSLQVRRELPLAHASPRQPSHSQPAPQSCRDL